MSQINSSHEEKQQAKDLGSRIASATKDVKDKVQDAASTISQKSQDLASNVARKTQDYASTAADKAQAGASAALEKTDQGIAATGHGMMTALAGTIRQSGPREGTAGTAARAVADNLQAGGHYLETHGMEAMSKDVKAMIYQHPLEALLVGFGVGCLVGMTMNRS
jgi:hypothetical protein